MPLKVMYPAADVPVLQLSIPTHDPERLLALGALARGDVDELARFRERAPGMPYAHPTVEHFTPLFVTLGAATDATAPVETTIEGWMFGLSKRSFQVA